MPKRDLLDLASLSSDDIEALIKRALYFKAKPFGAANSLRGASVGLLFEKPSTRTRISFEAAIVRLGGHPIVLSRQDLQLTRGETVSDTARVIGRYLAGLIIRAPRHAYLEEWAAASPVPVINGLSDLHHPCQILADLLTLFECRGALKGLHLSYIGDGNNIAHSLMVGGAKMGMDVTLASPRGFMPDAVLVQQATEWATTSGSKIIVTEDPMAAASGADVLYTDVWVSMGDEGEESERRRVFQPYQLNAEIVARAQPDCIVMHCLPAHRGEEITGDLMDGKHSVIFEQAANRLPMHQAILEWLLGGM